MLRTFRRAKKTKRGQNMASNKLALPVALLLCGLMVIGFLQTTEAELCQFDCQVSKYMTCPSQGSKQLFPACNCCFARNMEKGCIIYYNNGTMSECSKK